MSTQSVSLSNLTPSQLAFLSVPQELQLPPDDDSAPPWASTYSARLADLGLIDKAFRADDDGKYFHWYKDANGEKFRRTASNSMLRTTLHYAMENSKDQYLKYQRFDELVNTLFSTAYVKFRIDQFSEAKPTIAAIRQAIKSTLPGALDKIGYLEGNWTVKILYRSSIDGQLARQLQALLPPGASFTWHNHHKKDLPPAIKSFVAPDLPSCDTLRADMEKVLDRIHQTAVHGFSKAERQKFVYDPNHPYTNLSADEVVAAANGGKPCPKCGKHHPLRVPKNPRTGALARFVYGQIVGSTVRVIDLDDRLWMELSYLCPETP